MRTEDLIRSIARDLRPVQPLRGVEQRTALWAAFSLIAISLGTLALGARPDLRWKILDPAYLLQAAVLLAIFVLSARGAFQLSVPGAERNPRARMVPIAGLLLWGVLVAAGPSAADLPGSLNGAACLSTLTGLAVVPAFAALLMLRKGASFQAGWAGSFALLSVGSLAVLATRVVCARDDGLHVLLWHFAPVLAATLVGVRLGRRLLARAPVAVP